jgi:hypothetical protein
MMIPVIYELNDDGEANGTVHFFCSTGCRSQTHFKGSCFYQDGMNGLDHVSDGIRCETCGADINGKYAPETDSIFWVDIPTKETIDNPDGSWLNVGKFKTREEAVAWIRDNIGVCDDKGNVCLITEGSE